jgi:hypothetical protein
MVVTRSLVYIALAPAVQDDVPERGIYCDPIHVLRVEPLADGKRPSAAGSNKKPGAF